MRSLTAHLEILELNTGAKYRSAKYDPRGGLSPPLQRASTFQASDQTEEGESSSAKESRKKKDKKSRKSSGKTTSQSSDR